MRRPALEISLPLREAEEVRHLAANAAWLLLVRWVAVVGQLLTIAVARGVFGVSLRLQALLAIIGFTFLSNLVFAAWVRRLHADGLPPRVPHEVRLSLASVMALDLVSLTGLLYFAGGSDNPFSVFYLVNLTLCGVILSARWGAGLTVLTVVGLFLLSFGHVELPELSRELDWLPRSRFGQLNLGQLGWIVAMATCGLVIVHFVSRVTRQLELTAAELRRVERERSRSDKLEALGTLAGGAAHELATPLSTIALVSKELIRQLEPIDVPAGLQEDLSLIRTEVDHCQTILQRMTGRAGRWMNESLAETNLQELVRFTLSELQQPQRVRVTLPESANRVELRVPQESLAQALRGLLQNSLDAVAPDSPVQLMISWDERRIQLVVQDDGPGMAREVLERAGEPFFTTKEPGRGMGLGLFLTRSVIERLGGRLTLSSEAGRGVTAVVELPR